MIYFCIKNEELCIKNRELCIKIEKFCSVPGPSWQILRTAGVRDTSRDHSVVVSGDEIQREEVQMSSAARGDPARFSSSRQMTMYSKRLAPGGYVTLPATGTNWTVMGIVATEDASHPSRSILSTAGARA